MSNPNIQGIVKCETCDKEMKWNEGIKVEGSDEDYYLCEECMGGGHMVPATDEWMHQQEQNFINSFSN